MNTRQRFPAGFRRSTIVAAALALAVALAITGATLAAGGPPSAKQAALDKVKAVEATKAAGPRAPKPTLASLAPSVPAPSFCPKPPIQTGIGPVLETPFHADATYTNGAGAISHAGDFYYIFAGALRSDPQQGVLITMVEDGDPCKVSHRQAPSHAGLYTYPSPSRGGALTLTQIVGDTVTFNVADGSHGSFNFVAGQYLNS